MRAQGWVQALFLLAGWELWSAAAAASDCARPSIDAAATLDGIELRFDSSVEEVSQSEAIAMWQVCAGYGTGFPAFSVGTELPRYFNIRQLTEAGPGICGELRGREITLYAFAQTANGDLVWCGEPGKSLAHELGHALGLVDAREDHCKERIMATHPGERKRIDTRQITAEECAAVDRRWLTAPEVAALERDAANRDLLTGLLPVSLPVDSGLLLAADANPPIPGGLR